MSIATQLATRGIAEVAIRLTPEARAQSLSSRNPEDIWDSMRTAFHLAETSTVTQIAEAARHERRSRGIRSALAVKDRKDLPMMAAAERPPEPLLVYPHLGLALGIVDATGYKRVKAHKNVSRVVGLGDLRPIRPVETAAASFSDIETWPMEMLGVDALWSLGLTGKGIRVAHLDTGADGKHPALHDAIKGFIVTDDLGRRVPGNVAAFEGHDSGHGTHTGATIAGRPVRGRRVGVAPEAELYSALVIEGGRVVARVLQGMEWAIESGARVISVSLGLPGFDRAFEMIIEALRLNGVLPVVAIGNEGPGTSRYPGNYSSVLSVGAVDKDRRVPSFSSSQRFSRTDQPITPDIVAPGRDIVSAAPGGGYVSMSGTSMATPHVAGLAALLLEAKPAATIDELEAAILASASCPPSITPERGNLGIPDGPKALQLLTAGPGGAKRAARVRSTHGRKGTRKGKR